MTQAGCLDHAIEVTKEYARGGGNQMPDVIIELVYKKLMELSKQVTDGSDQGAVL